MGASKTVGKSGSPGWTRTSDIWINSPPFYQLNYRGIENFVVKNLSKFYINRSVLNTPPLLGSSLFCYFRTLQDTKRQILATLTILGIGSDIAVGSGGWFPLDLTR